MDLYDSMYENLSSYKQEEEEKRDQLFKFIDILQLEVKEKFERLTGFIKSWNEVSDKEIILKKSKSI